MNRAQLIGHIRSLSDAEFRRIGPNIEALMESEDYLKGLRAAIARGRKSAAEEPLIPHAEVMRQMRARHGKAR